MSIKKIIAACALTFLIIVGVILTIDHVSSLAWEKTLRGPFTGTEFFGVINNKERSRLQIESSVFLCVYENEAVVGPVLALRTVDGNTVWARSLFVSNAVERLQNVDLVSASRSDSGYKVRITCNWEMGKEAGLIYLKDDLSFISYALSW
jgi:hypothetical protein